MDSYLIYIFQVSCVFAILYLTYNLLFSQLTFHSTNRLWLLMMLPFSFILPVLNLGLNSFTFGNYLIPRFDEIAMLTNANKEVISDLLPTTDVYSILIIVYCVGLMVFVSRLVSNAIKLIFLKQKSEFYRDNGYLVIYANIPNVFSCFYWIFVPSMDNKKIDETILQHEKLHAKLGHTVDLILMEIFVAILWFNPFVYFFRKSIKSVHEFQVDSMILKSNNDSVNYLRLILQQLNNNYRSKGLYQNYFSGLTIKKRVKMITNNKSSKIQIFRYLILMPVVALLLMAFSSFSGQRPELFPIKKGEYTKITSLHGQSFNNPFTQKKSVHKGIDIKAMEGIDILATASGKVVKVTEEKGWGKLIVIDHGNGIESWYAHLKNFNVKMDEVVEKGQTIGYVGNTGYSTSPHLHFEIRFNEKSVDPLSYVKK